MRRLVYIVFSLSAILSSCSDDYEPTGFSGGYSINVAGDAPNAKVTIDCEFEGITKLFWTFTEGDSIFTSTEENFSFIVDKAGEIDYNLKMTDGSIAEEESHTLTIDGYNAILTYTDVSFGLKADDPTYGRVFSFGKGKIYTDSEITESNGALMDLVFSSISDSVFYFDSPSNEDYNIPNAVETLVVNYESTPSVSVADFESMDNDSILSGLTIVSDEGSFGSSSIPGTILFQLSDGRNGVIKTKSIDSDRLIADIKVQKY